ncbi:MAG: SMC-Scp complex subunit ScpB [Candidatus Andersenbacteria bacterium]|nr:SMC-Scp complex subunit ScpB [Candidatus Andersenbacteria bacterium]
MTQAAQHIEALLFVAGEAVPKKDLAKLAGLDEAQLADVLLELSQSLTGHGIVLMDTAQGVQLVTSPDVGAFLETFLAEGTSALSRAASETLALVAYRGPVSRYDLEAIRGVDCRRILSHLVFRGLVVKEPTDGQAMLYDISADFLMHMGITAKEQLPQYEALRNNERLRELLSADTQ